MPIEFVTGDLFVNRHKAHALAHGVNCKGSMGSGIAVGFRERYPTMFEEYKRRCQAKPRELNPGDVFLWKTEDEDQPWVFNLATQEDYWFNKAQYPTVEQCLLSMKAIAISEQIGTIAMPRIGAGLGGLSWKKLKPIIERTFVDWSGTLYVYEEFVAGS